MSITRRQFIKGTGAMTAGSFLAPWLHTSVFQRALADTIGDRYLVVVYLDGGNDGVNTITPLDDGSTLGLRTAYQTMRKSGPGGLRLPLSGQGALLIPNTGCEDVSTGTPLGFHPALAGVKNLYDLGTVAVIQGCGHPTYSLSHDAARNNWQTGDPLHTGYFGGWIGRYLAANYNASDIPAINVGDRTAGEFQQTSTNVVAVPRLDSLNFPYDPYDTSPGEIDAKRAAFLSLCGVASASAQATVKFLGNAATATERATESYPQLVGIYDQRPGTWSSQYAALNTPFARELGEVARVIYGVETMQPDVTARLFEVTQAGFDTHADQGGLHYDLLRRVSDALELFYHDCVDMGAQDKVCVLVWTEFGRRIEQNVNGTDHGSQGPVFVIGGQVQGGVYGNHPNVNPTALDENGNPVYWQGGPNPEGWTRSTDLRDIYGTILKHWLGLANPLSILPLDLGDIDLTWQLPHFDLNFLP